MLGPIQQSIASVQESFLGGGLNFNNLGRFGLGAIINILSYHPISLLIDRLENRLETIEESKKFPRKVVAFSSLACLLNIAQVKILLGARLGIIASVAVIVTLTALMTLKYIYDKTKGNSSPSLGNSSPSPNLQESVVVRPSRPDDGPNSSRPDDGPNPESLLTDITDELDGDDATEQLLLLLAAGLDQDSPYQPWPIPSTPQPAVESSTTTHEGVHASQIAEPSNPPPASHLNTHQGPPLNLILLSNLQKPIADNILKEEQYRILENALHCRRETLNYLFTGLEITPNDTRKEIVFNLLNRQSTRITSILSSREFLPEGQNHQDAYLDEHMKKLFDYYIEESMREKAKENPKLYSLRYQDIIKRMIERFPNKEQARLMRRIFNTEDDPIYTSSQYFYADTRTYTVEELREFVRYFLPNPTSDQTSAILEPLFHAGRIIQKHQDEPERTGFKAPTDPGVKDRVMNFFKFEFKKMLYSRSQGTGMTVLEFKMIFKDIIDEYQLFAAKSEKFILAIKP